MTDRTAPPDAFAALYAEHAPRIRRVLLTELRPADHHTADDLTQEVFLALWVYLRRGDRITRPAGLLTVMARHKVIDHYRSARVRREVSTDPTTRGVLDQAARELVAA
jgi:RNA polymerase sigma factor (sigma-70 family)